MDERRWTTSRVGSLPCLLWLSLSAHSCFWPRLPLSLTTRTDTTTATPGRSPRKRTRPTRMPTAKRNPPKRRVRPMAIRPTRDRRARDRQMTDPMTRPSNARPGRVVGTRMRRDESRPAPRSSAPHPPVGTFRDVMAHMARTRDTAPTETDPTTRTTTRVTDRRPSTGTAAGTPQEGRVPGASAMPTTSSPRVKLRTVRITTTATSAMATAGSERRTRPTPGAGSRRRNHPRRLRVTGTTIPPTGSSRAFTRNHRATRITTPPTGSSLVCHRSHRSHPSLRGPRTERIGCSRSRRSFPGPRTSSCRKDPPVYCREREQVRSCSSRLVSG